MAAYETTPAELTTMLEELVGFKAKNVATPVPKPETPVLIGKPVQLVNVPLAGVPKAGVTNVGLVEPTKFPVPVCPLKLVLTELLVAMSYPYVMVIFPCGADPTCHSVFATVQMI